MSSSAATSHSIAAHHAFVSAADRGLIAAAAVTLTSVIVALRTLPGPARSAQPVIPEQPTHARA